MMRTWPILGVSVLLGGCTQDYQVKGAMPDVDPGDVTDCGFTQIEDTDFYRYDCNPVFTTTGEDWAESIGSTAFLVTDVMGHPFYQMWYNGSRLIGANDSDESVGYAISAQGTDWEALQSNPVMDTPGGNAWDGDSIDGMSVIWDPYTEQYVMMYQGINFSTSNIGLGVATSPTGQEWTRLPNNPIVDMTASAGYGYGYDGESWCWPLDLTLGGVSGYSGYVAGGPELTFEEILEAMALGEPAVGHCDIYRVAGENVSEWYFTDDVVLEAGESGEWDDSGFIDMAIAEIEGSDGVSQRYMFYIGFDGWVESGVSGFVSATNPHMGMAREIGNYGSEIWAKEDGYMPVDVDPNSTGTAYAVAASTVGSRIHLWVTDVYEGDETGVGYFLFDPNRSDGDE